MCTSPFNVVDGGSEIVVDPNVSRETFFTSMLVAIRINSALSEFGSENKQDPRMSDTAKSLRREFKYAVAVGVSAPVVVDVYANVSVFKLPVGTVIRYDPAGGAPGSENGAVALDGSPIVAYAVPVNP